MKRSLLFLTVFFSMAVFGCKCNEPTIRSSFESADFVFIGEVYDVNTTYKTGYWEVENSLARVKIDKIYKSLVIILKVQKSLFLVSSLIPVI